MIRTLIRNCKQCGSEFEFTGYPSFIKRGGGKYCSKECLHNSMKNRKQITCIGCGKTFEWKVSRVKNRNPVYCSRSCYFTYSKRDSYKVDYMKKWFEDKGLTVFQNHTESWLINSETNHHLYLDLYWILELIFFEKQMLLVLHQKAFFLYFLV